MIGWLLVVGWLVGWQVWWSALELRSVQAAKDPSVPVEHAMEAFSVAVHHIADAGAHNNDSDNNAARLPQQRAHVLQRVSMFFEGMRCVRHQQHSSLT